MYFMNDFCAYFKRWTWRPWLTSSPMKCQDLGLTFFVASISTHFEGLSAVTIGEGKVRTLLHIPLDNLLYWNHASGTGDFPLAIMLWFSSCVLYWLNCWSRAGKIWVCISTWLLQLSSVNKSMTKFRKDAKKKSRSKHVHKARYNMKESLHTKITCGNSWLQFLVLELRRIRFSPLLYVDRWIGFSWACSPDAKPLLPEIFFSVPWGFLIVLFVAAASLHHYSLRRLLL